MQHIPYLFISVQFAWNSSSEDETGIEPIFIIIIQYMTRKSLLV